MSALAQFVPEIAEPKLNIFVVWLEPSYIPGV